MTDTSVDPAVVAFQTRARNCEAIAASRPRHYRRIVTLLALLGYAFPLLVLTLLTGLVVALVAARFGWFEFISFRVPAGFLTHSIVPLAVLYFVVVRAMWPRFEPPDGVLISATDATELVSFVEDIRRQAGGPPMHRIYITDELNAGARQTPRLGFFGWHRNDLILGLPLMQALTRQELAAVVAHEFGHLAGEHGKLGAWIYRTRLLMSRILAEFEKKRRTGSWIFRRFYSWFEPYFAAYSFTLAREQEYEADGVSARVTAGQTNIDALVRVKLANEYLASIFWNKIWSATAEQASPPGRVYRELGDALASVAQWEGAASSLEEQLSYLTDYADTHPSLTDRARALNATPILPGTQTERSVDLLANGGETMIDTMSARWREDVEANWTLRYREVQERRGRLVELESEMVSAPLSAEDAYERARLAEEFMTLEEALERYEYAYSRAEASDPEFHAASLYAAGRMLNLLGREACVLVLKRVMQQYPDYTVACCQWLESFFEQAGRASEAEEYQKQRVSHEQLFEEDWNDRAYASENDTFLVHECGSEQLNAIVDDLQSFGTKKVKRAWLIRKVTQHRQWEPAHLLIIDVGGWNRWTTETDELRDELNAVLTRHEGVVTFVCNIELVWLSKKAETIAGAQIYP